MSGQRASLNALNLLSDIEHHLLAFTEASPHFEGWMTVREIALALDRSEAAVRAALAQGSRRITGRKDAVGYPTMRYRASRAALLEQIAALRKETP